MAWVAACGAADTEAAWAVEAASAAAIAAGAECGAAAAYAAPLEGAGRYGYIDTPEPVTAADIDLSGIVTRAEFLSAAGRRFELLDANRDGSIGERELPRLKVNPHRERPRLRSAPVGRRGAGRRLLTRASLNQSCRHRSQRIHTAPVITRSCPQMGGLGVGYAHGCKSSSRGGPGRRQQCRCNRAGAGRSRIDRSGGGPDRPRHRRGDRVRS